MDCIPNRWEIYFESLTFIAYYAIPVLLIRFVRRLPVDSPASRLLLALTTCYYAFCGLGHLLYALNSYFDVPRGMFIVARGSTAIISTVAACVIIVSFPKFLSLIDKAKMAVESEKRKEIEEARIRAKTQFLALVSHELRTPLHAIVGVSDLLQDSRALDDEQLDYCSVISTNANQLLSMVDDLLAFGKYEFTGSLEVELEETHIRDTLDAAFEVVTFQARQKGLKLAYHVEHEVPTQVITDSKRLKQILINLTANSIKFSTEGEIVVTVKAISFDQFPEYSYSTDSPYIAKPPSRKRLTRSDAHPAPVRPSDLEQGFGGLGERDEEAPILQNPEPVHMVSKKLCGFDLENPLRLVFQVRDTGSGIARENIPLLFDKFSQVGDSTAHRLGSGLGLGICLELVTRLGGALAVESIMGEGSCFTFDILVDVPSTTMCVAPSPLQNKLVALCLCDKRQHLTLCGSVASLNCNVLEFEDSGSMLEHLKSAADTSAIAAILDWSVLSQLPAGDSYPPIIVIGESEDDDSSYQFPPVFSIIRTHPSCRILRKKLLAAIEHPTRIRKSPQTVEKVAITNSDSVQLLQVLVAEDNLVNQKVIRKLLQRLGCEVKLVKDGQESVDLLAAGDSFDLVLMDINMPVLDGVSAVKLIRKLQLSNQPWVCVMTADITANTKKECFQAGVNDFVEKPVGLAQVEGILSRFKSKTPRRMSLD